VPEYRAFIIGQDGRVIKAHELEYPDDLSATEAARQFVDGHDVELWSFDRKVAQGTHRALDFVSEAIEVFV